VLNSVTRNAYKSNGNINPKGSWDGCLFKTNAKNTRLLNCILLNPYGDGIYCTWQGKKNEVSNCFILNTFHCAISTRSAQPDSVIKIRNNTIAFSWFQPGKGGSVGIFVGRQGQTIIENNVMTFCSTESSGGVAVQNSFGNEDTILKHNLFFQLQGGAYKYMDDDGKNLLIWKKSDLDDLNEEAEDYMLLEAEGNKLADPQLKPDKDYFSKFAGFVAAKPGKLNMDSLNKWRRSLGLPLQAEASSARKNWGMIYPLDKVVPNLVSKVKGVGVQASGPFPTYKSAVKVAVKLDYKAVSFDTFKKGSATAKAYANSPIALKVGMGNRKSDFVLEEAPNSDYVCFQLLKSGVMPPTRNYVFGYILKGSEAHKKWTKYYKKKNKYNKKGGVKIKGRAFALKNQAYPYPVGLIIDSVKR
jgi:hypothetical protein